MIENECKKIGYKIPFGWQFHKLYVSRAMWFYYEKQVVTSEKSDIAC